MKHLSPLFRGTCSILVFIAYSFFLYKCIEDEPVKITSVSPLIGCRGKSLSIIGWGFSPNKIDNVVKVNGIAVEITEAVNNKLVVSLPDTVMTGKITVKVGKNSTTGPQYSITDPRYFIDFKFKDTRKYFESCDQGYPGSSACAAAVVPFINSTYQAATNAYISICDNSGSKVSGTVMKSWVGKTFLFSGANLQAIFDFYENRIVYSSRDATDQTGSELTITHITPDMSAVRPNSYIATGYFKCNVTNPSGDYFAVTEGSFSVRFTESN